MKTHRVEQFLKEIIGLVALLAGSALAASVPASGIVTSVRLSSNVTLADLNGSPIVLSQDGTLGGIPVSQVALDASGNLELLAGSHRASLGISTGGALSLDGLSGRLGSIHLLQPGDPTQITTPAGNVACTQGGTSQSYSVSIVKSDLYELDLSSGEGSIYFSLDSYETPWGWTSDCRAD